MPRIIVQSDHIRIVRFRSSCDGSLRVAAEYKSEDAMGNTSWRPRFGNLFSVRMTDDASRGIEDLLTIISSLVPTNNEDDPTPEPKNPMEDALHYSPYNIK